MIKCKKCGKLWDDGTDNFLEGIGVVGLKSDTNLCPDCIQIENNLNNTQIIFDNAGGVTLQLPGFSHYYQNPKQAAEHYHDFMVDGTTEGWDGHEEEAAELEPEDEQIRVGGYKVYGHSDIMDECENDTSTAWGNIDDFCTELTRLRDANGNRNMKIYNGENINITIVTDLGDTIIPAKTTVEVEIPEDAVLNLHDASMYVEEEGSWYSKTEQCGTGADMEIYSEDILLDHVSFTTDTDWVKENDEEVYDVLHDIMDDFVSDEQNSCDNEDMENFEAGNWKVEYLFRDGEAIYTAGRDDQHLANQDGWSRDKISDIEPEKISLYKNML